MLHESKRAIEQERWSDEKKYYKEEEQRKLQRTIRYFLKP